MIQARSGGSLIGRISSYLQIVSKDPHSTAFVPLAEAYRQIGLLDDALEAARRGTGMLPHFSPGFATLGRILGQMGHIDEAMAAYSKALSIDRQGQSALVGLARLHLVRGEREAARKILNEAAEYHPQDEMIENMLVALDLPRPWGRPQPEMPGEAAEEETADNAGGEPIPTATLAEIYARQGLTDQAVRVYREILRLDPNNTAAARRLQELSADSSPAPVQSAAPPAAPPQAAPSALPSRQPLEIMLGWLQAIQARRSHVH
jgi:tetratricopeptide (TPR) repeat protein